MVFVVKSGNECNVISLIGQRYYRISFPWERFLDLYIANDKNQRSEMNGRELSSKIKAADELLSNYIKPLLDQLISSNCSEMMIVPDKWSEMLPFISAVVGDERFRHLLRRGGFYIKYCPILYRGRQGSSAGSFLGIWNSNDELPFSDEEISMVSKLCPSESSVTLDIGKVSGIQDYLTKCSTIHFAIDGFAVSQYSDPVFAEMGSSENCLDGLSPLFIQSVFYKHPYSLAFLNVCHSAAVISKNAVRNYATNEIISYPSLLLMNRQSQVIGSMWSTLDSAAFVFSKFFYSQLAVKKSVPAAYSAALVEMFDADSDQVAGIFLSIKDHAIRDKQVDRVGCMTLKAG